LGVKASLLVTATMAALLTVVVSVSSLVSFAYRSPGLHVAVETAAALISLVAAQLVWGRFRESLQLRQLLLVGSLSTFATANLLFSAVPAIADDDFGGFATWAPAGGRLLGAALMAASAVAPDRVLRHPMRDARRLLAACMVGLAGLSVAVALAGDALPAAIPPDLSPESSGTPRIVGNSAVLATEVAVMLLFAVAALGYAQLAQRNGDVLTRWLAIAATLGAFSRLNFFLFPSLYSPYFYTGDVLRLAFFVSLAVGGALEMRRTQEVLTTAAVLDERERIARDIHDGVAQDLAFILQHGRRLAGNPGAPAGVGTLVTAAERALDECRHAIASLTRTGGEPLAEALTLTALETAGREGAMVQTDIDAKISVPAACQEALLRVTREAIINAIRHGGAKTINIELFERANVYLIISDDGRGFDVQRAAAAPGHLGIRTMEARIRAVGGEFAIDSEPGRGTRIRVSLP
jgi:signal transduction histidine kinase